MKKTVEGKVYAQFATRRTDICSVCCAWGAETPKGSLLCIALGTACVENGQPWRVTDDIPEPEPPPAPEPAEATAAEESGFVWDDNEFTTDNW